MKFLIVEDNKINQKVLSTYIYNFDPTAIIKVVDNGQEAKAAFVEEYDAIFLDLGLPDINGFDLAKFFRSEIKKDIPIIAYSAHFQERQKMQAQQAGINGYLEKPIDYKRFLEVVSEWLDK